MKVKFQWKAGLEDLIPQNEFVVEKTVILSKTKFERFILDYGNNEDFIEENIELMYVESNGLWHCILVTCEEVDYGILIESEGYSYPRYAAYIHKSSPIPVKVNNIPQKP